MIIKEGFHLINNDIETGYNDIETNYLEIQDNIYAGIFLLDFNKNIKIVLNKNSTLEIYGFFTDFNPEKIEIIQQESSKLIFKAIFMGKKEISCDISNLILGNNSTSSLNIISIVKNNNISINSSIEVVKNLSNIDAKLNLENIFIGNNGQISSIPKLFVSTKDIKISHSSKTQRIPEDKIFYLNSRGLSYEDSLSLILNSYFLKIFICVEMFDIKLFNIIKEKFLKSI